MISILRSKATAARRRDRYARSGLSRTKADARSRTIRNGWRNAGSARRAGVAVLGAGNGGLALAAYLSRTGHRVALWNRSAGPVDLVAARGGVGLTMPGSAAAIERIAIATNDIATALAGAKVILVAVPASAHTDIARTCARHLRDGQTVLLLPGRTGGALEFRRLLEEQRCPSDVLLGEANSFPFAARTVGPAEAVIFGAKVKLLAAALPARRTDELVANCRAFLPMLAPAASVLHTGLSNLGAVLHPAITLMNAGRIIRGEVFDFYTEGVTPQIARVLAAADEERHRIAEAYGVCAQPLTEWIACAYGHVAATMQGAVVGNPAYIGIKAPRTLCHRYLLEDAPMGLIPLIELGRAAGLASPTLRSLVTLAEFVLGAEPWRQVRSLESLGLAGMTIGEIRSAVASGFLAGATRAAMAHAGVSGRYGLDLGPGWDRHSCLPGTQKFLRGRQECLPHEAGGVFA